MSRGEIYLMQYKTGKKGRETFHSVPVVIVQNNLGNEVGNTTIIAMTCNDCVSGVSPVHVHIEVMGESKFVLLDNIHTVNKRILTECIGELDWDQMRELDEGLMFSFGMEESFVY